MPPVKYTAFHVDFSTLDIEKGQVSLEPFQFAYVVSPPSPVENGGNNILDSQDEMEILPHR